MEKKVVVVALLVCFAYWMVQMAFWDWGVPIVSLPFVGTVWEVKPLQIVDSFALFFGSILTLTVVYFMLKLKTRRGGE